MNKTLLGLYVFPKLQILVEMFAQIYRAQYGAARLMYLWNIV